MSKQPTFTEISPAVMLKKHGVRWWWRDVDPHPWATYMAGPQTKARQLHAHREWLFHTDYAEAAYRYELVARINGKFEFGGDWTTLDAHQTEQLARRWPTPTKPGGNASIILQMDGPPRPAQDGWSTPQTVSLNLRHNNEALIGAFLKLITRLRDEHGIRPRPNEGARNRGDRRVWRLIELLDVQRFKIRLLDNTEWSQVSKVVREAKASL
jgi:hypothetical protein